MLRVHKVLIVRKEIKGEAHGDENQRQNSEHLFRILTSMIFLRDLPMAFSKAMCNFAFCSLWTEGNKHWNIDFRLQINKI